MQSPETSFCNLKSNKNILVKIHVLGFYGIVRPKKRYDNGNYMIALIGTEDCVI